MNNPMFSLVVPVYNVAPYLRQCLDSLQAQTKLVDEIIAVDDGSTDDSPAILAEYARRLPQMRVIRQENGGLSAARNTGMRHASGKYLAFVDSDDFLAADAYRLPLERAEIEQLDMVIFNACYHYEGRAADRPVLEGISRTGVISGRDWLRQRLRQGRLPHMVWMQLYRRAFLLNGAWQFVPGLIHEDVIWTTQVLLAASRLAYEPVIAYFYRIPIRRFSPEQNQRRLEAVVESSIFNARTLAAIAADPAIDAELRDLLARQLVDGAFSVFHKLEKMPDPAAKKTIFNRLRNEGWYRFLWQNAHGFTQYRRIARRYLRALIP
jgi:glycosyltransferase involved in cell wall biosynthesis